MATIWVDGRSYEVDAGHDMLRTCLSLGFDLPYFCWHPALGAVGACRQCAVKQYEDAEDDRGRIVMACMTPVSDGTRISIRDPEAQRFRANVIQWLMVNHPHDCPVCDEGGECHLQDMTVMTGHVYRHFRYKKRTYRNQDLGPLVNHEMNRCIQCYRCVRFYRDYAGGSDLDAFAIHDHVYFGRAQDGTLESPFAGNLVEVCPTGVFTDKTLKQHYTRKWDLQTAPSVCAHCGLGCNTTPGERYGTLRRVRARYHADVNRYFLCDRGRYGYGFTNGERRLRAPLAPRGTDAPAERLSVGDAVDRAAAWLGDPERTVGVGSPRASLEANFALATLVGAERFHAGVESRQHDLAARVAALLQRPALRAPSLHDVERADAVLVLGEDATQTAPMLALALRQAARQEPMGVADEQGIPRWNDAAVREAVQQRRGPIFLAMPFATELDDAARRAWRASPVELSRLAFAVAHALDDSAPEPAKLDGEMARLAREIAHALVEARAPLVVCGTSLGSAELLEGAGNVALALARRRRSPADFCCVIPECNSLGLALLRPRPLEEAFQALERGAAETLVVLETDLFRRAPREQVERALGAASRVVVIDSFAHETGARASLLLPSTTVFEGDGTFVSSEGRAQRFFRVFPPQGEQRESWLWLRDVLCAAGRTEAEGWARCQDVGSALGQSFPVFREGLPARSRAGLRLAGARVPRKPFRYSGRTAMVADETVHEPPPPDDPDSPFAFSMEGYQGRPPGGLVPEFWAPGWNSIQALNKFQTEVGGALLGDDPGVRLLEPAESPGPDAFRYSRTPPQGAHRRENRFQVVPLHHVFGSEELSAMAPGVEELVPEPYAALSPEDAEALGVGEGETLRIRLRAAGGGDADGETLTLPLRRCAGLARGLMGLPTGLPDLCLAGRLGEARVDRGRAS